MILATKKPREVLCDDCRRLHDEDVAERLSVCCGAPATDDAEIFCSQCRDSAVFEIACPPPCYQCGGSGEVPYVSPAGVVDRSYMVDCGACDGSGAER